MSYMPGHQFHLFLLGEWEDRASPPIHHNPRDVAKDYALRTAQSISITYLLTDAAGVESRINTALGLPVDLRESSVRLLWARAHVSADALQQAAVAEQLRRNHEAALHDQEDQRRLQRAKDLRNALLDDPGIALAQWFMDQPEAINGNTIEQLNQIIGEVSSYAPETMWVKASHIIHDFVRNLPGDARIHLIETLAGIFERYGYPGHSKQLKNEVLKNITRQD